MRHIFLPFLFLLITFTAQAQTKLSPEPAQFVLDAKTLLLTGKGENAEQIGNDLEQLWNSGKLTQKQQSQVIDIAHRMYQKRMRSRPHFENFFMMLTGGINNHNLRGASLDEMLSVISKAVQQEEAASLDRFLGTSSLYLTSGKLYQNKFYTMRAQGGSFSFAFEGNSKNAADAAPAANSEWDNFSWDDEAAADEGELVDDGWGNMTKKTTAKKEDPKKAEQRRKESFKKQFVPAQPKVSGPVLKFENVTFSFATQYDSSSIQKTSGQLMLVRNLFVGEGGSYEWEADKKPVSAIFKKYNFDISFAGFKVPDATLTYPAVLDAPIDGFFEFLSTKRNHKGEKLYPRFASYTNDAKLKNLGSNITYRGGFTLSGDIIGSKPLDGSLSELAVATNGERKFRSMARNFNLNDSVITAARASIAIYQQKDSLTHPAMQLRYSKPIKELLLTKDSGPYNKAPFYDTYHQMEIVAERVQWELESSDINFSILNTKTLIPVQVESTKYFSNNRYQQLVGIASFHPLQALVAYAAKAKKSEFYASEVSEFNKVNEAAVKEAALGLARDGFLSYDGQTGFIKLKPKAWHYVGSSRKLNDYDHLVIKSVVPSGRNATLNLKDNKLTVRGVDKITFNSDTASVYIVPDSNMVHILKNRNMEFSGKVFASRLAFTGSKFKFNYDEFMIDLQQLDTVALVTRKERRSSGLASDQVLVGRAGKMSGKLYINKPDNKSGKEIFPEYPKFDAPIGAQVAFDRPDVLGGAYDSTVFFDMPPFKMDSLSAGKNAIAFDGTFNSGGIFPPIKTKLVMMPDASLGFYHVPPAAGLPAFGGKGMAYDTIMMSSAGIQSKGKITYLSGVFNSPEFTYYQNAVVTSKGSGATVAAGNKGGASFPQVTIKSYEMNWLPKQDTMYLLAVKEPMEVYKEGYKLKGTAKLTPGGLYASGEIDNPIANVVSSKLLFKERSFSGNHAQVIAKSDVEGRPAIRAQDVAINYDLTANTVEFGSERKGAASIEFPKAQYKTSMSSATWDMNKQKVSLKADDSGGKNFFYSQHPEQAGLRFSAASGEYGLKDNTIFAGGVPHIAVGDVFVMPDSGKVAVASDATIRTLRNARVMADSLQQFHRLHTGNIDILSRNAMKGDAVHDYSNAASDSFKLRFANFEYGNPKVKKPTDEKEKKKVNDSKKAKGEVYTFATAAIEEGKPFYIFPRILYRGDVMLHSSKEFMDFNGFLKLNFTGNEGDSDWFAYKKDSLDPNNVRIPIIKPKMADGTLLHTGLHVSRGDASLYNTFVSKKYDDDDLDLFGVDGYLSYDKTKKEFIIGQEERAYANSYEGNVLRYDEANNTIYFDGKLNLLKPMKNFSVEAAGSGSAKTDSSRYNIDALLAFDLTLPSKAIEEMGTTIKATSAGAAALDNSELMLYKLGNFIGDREVRKYIATSSSGHLPLPKVSAKLARSIVFSSVNMKWSNERKAWYSVGKLGLSNIMKDDINRMVDGYLEMRQDMNGEPAVNLYIQSDAYTWYYLSFLENGLEVVSSDPKFNKAVSSKSKGTRGSTSSYGFYIGDSFEKNQFLEQFKQNYLSGEDGFKIASDRTLDVEAPPIGGNGANFADEEDEPKKKKKKKEKKKKADPFGTESEVDE